MRWFTESCTSWWLLRSAKAVLIAGASLAGLWCGDAMTVNPDGSVLVGVDPGTTESLRATGLMKAPNVLSGLTPVAVTGTVTLTTAAFGQWHLVSGTSSDYAITLPTVVGSTGRCIGIRVQDTTAASKIYTLTPVGGQKIDGQTTVAMAANQAVVLMSDGIQWARIAGQPGSSGGGALAALGDWQDGGTVTILDSATGPAKGNAIRDKVWWRRSGDSAEIVYEYVQNTAGGAGSGNYRFRLPAGLTIDTAKIYTLPATSMGERGGGAIWNVSVWAPAFVTYCAPNELSVVYNGSLLSSTNAPLSGSSVRYCFWAHVPIAGWSGTQVVQNGSRYLWTQKYGAGTQVTVTPSQPGQWRSYRKSANSQAGVDGAPLALPSASDGFRITSANYATAATDATRYEIYVGPNKVVAWEFAANAGRTGYLMADRAQYGSTFGSTWGMDRGYDRNTGIAWIDTQIQDSTVTGRFCGNALPLGGGSATSVTTAYFDLLVADDPVPVAQAAKVYLEATSSAGQAVVANTTDLQYENKAVDTHSAWNGNVFTAPMAGVYLVTATTGLNMALQLRIFKNGAVVVAGSGIYSGVGYQNATVNGVISLAQGDVLSLRVTSNMTRTTVVADNRLSIYRLGD